jgi:uncharacterized protein (DUF433 family)
MQIEEYFEHFGPDDIRIKGTRVGIESILYEFIHREQTPETIAKQLPSLTLEQVYATILYYLSNKVVIEAYMTEWLAFGERMRAEQIQNPPPVVLRLRHLKQQQGATV